MRRTNIYLDDQDREALRVIRDEHGIATDASAVRFAIRSMARDIEQRARRGGRARSVASSSPAPARRDD
jgi:hypothetical protein